MIDAALGLHNTYRNMTKLNSLFFLAISCLTLTTGCTITKIEPPGMGAAYIFNERVFGLKATIPSQTGQSFLNIALGFGSSSMYVIPVSTNTLHTVTIADGLNLGQSVGMTPDTTIKETFIAGYDSGTPPQMLLSKPGVSTNTAETIINSEKLKAIQWQKSQPAPAPPVKWTTPYDVQAMPVHLSVPPNSPPNAWPMWTTNPPPQ